MHRLTRTEYFIWFLLGAIGLTLFLVFQPRITPLAKVEVSRDRGETARIAEEYLASHGFDLSNLDQLTRAVRFLPSQLQQMPYQVYGFSEEDYDFLEQRSPAYYWSVAWFDDNGRSVYEAVVGTDGVPFGFNHWVAEDVPGKVLTQEEAKEVMDDFLQTQLNIDLSNYELLEVASDRQTDRMDYYLNYYSTYTFPKDIQLHLRTTVRGDRVDQVTTYFFVPERYRDAVVQQLQDEFVFRVIVVPVILVAIFIVLSILYILRFHAGEIAVKAPIIVGVLYAALMAAMAFNVFDFWSVVGVGNLSPTFKIIGYLVVWTLGGVIGAVMILQAWSVGDSIIRERWGYKLTFFDLISRGRIFFPSLWSSVFVGYMAGFLALGIWSSLAFVATHNFSAWTETEGSLFLLTSSVPAIEVVGEALTDSLFYSFVGVLFLVGLFKKYLKIVRNETLNTFVALLLMALLVSFGQSIIPVYPVYWRYAIAVLTTFFLGLVFVRYDLIAVLIGWFVLSGLQYGYQLLTMEHSTFLSSGVAVFVLALVPMVIGLIARLWGRELTQEELEVKPSYVKLITQRERMAHELDIARKVQMSLLPKKNPVIDGFDIAGTCLPALEVGGDYYDFFDLDDGKMGIAIGDVSGKGVPAAIYMTLTKGVLQTSAMVSSSPKEVLNKLNRQMYTNIERNSFVSIYYAVLDNMKRTMRIARAGHNPAILTHRDTDQNLILIPKGIAVGLEPGPKFQQFLEEDEIDLVSGDVLTLYTDGFTEARRHDGEEYGEDRLLEVISRFKNRTASEIIDRVVQSIREFTGNQPQHDDMTMVVIKVE
ncbi:MAG: PP2C family protein-serine/threonine phosphatase [Bacteroidetes bacterium]|nr:PP2C family protein-serine/threonine phosphatase [Bacteroidota bacterium]